MSKSPSQFKLPKLPRNVHFDPGPEPLKPRHSLKKFVKAPLAKPSVRAVKALGQAPKVSPKPKASVTPTLRAAPTQRVKSAKTVAPKNLSRWGF